MRSPISAASGSSSSLAVLLALVDWWRNRNRWYASLPARRPGRAWSSHNSASRISSAASARPSIPAAARLGPSFPSGHSATAAAFYAAAALIVGRTLRRPTRQIVVAAAVAIAVAVAASRVLLDLHWLSDVVGGLALGWAWFALSAVVFGGRLLRPTAAADIVAAEATSGAGDRKRPASPSSSPKTGATS